MSGQQGMTVKHLKATVRQWHCIMQTIRARIWNLWCGVSESMCVRCKLGTGGLACPNATWWKLILWRRIDASTNWGLAVKVTSYVSSCAKRGQYLFDLVDTKCSESVGIFKSHENKEIFPLWIWFLGSSKSQMSNLLERSCRRGWKSVKTFQAGGGTWW